MKKGLLFKQKILVTIQNNIYIYIHIVEVSYKREDEEAIILMEALGRIVGETSEVILE